MSKKKPKHPMQPIVLDEEGTARFKKNAIVRYILEESKRVGVDMNYLARMEFSAEDREQFAQLIGYSVSGFGELSYASDQVYDKAIKQVEKLTNER